MAELSKRTLDELQQLYPEVFAEPTFPVERPTPFEHEIRLADEGKPPPKRRLYPLD